MTKDEKKKEYDIFRDSMLRYAGYANEIGESFRYQYPALVVPSYWVAFSYCAADAATNGYQTWKRDASAKKSLIATVDTLLWQTLASVMIPGATINLIVKASRIAVRRSPMSALAKEWFPTAMGLGSIPFIVSPIDHGVDWLLDATTRQWFPISNPSRADESPLTPK